MSRFCPGVNHPKQDVEITKFSCGADALLCSWEVTTSSHCFCFLDHIVVQIYYAFITSFSNVAYFLGRSLGRLILKRYVLFGGSRGSIAI